MPSQFSSFFFFNDTATTEIYTLSLHDALPISFALVELDADLLETEPLDERPASDGDEHQVGLHGLAVTEEQDRKSTRLNSSHSQISYAVFCLKKKTKVRMQRVYLSIRVDTLHP